MTDPDWLTRFRREREEFEDEGLERLVELRGQSSQLIRWLSAAVDGIARDLEAVETRVDSLAEEVRDRGHGPSGGPAAAADDPASAASRAQMERLIEATRVSTDAPPPSNIPVIPDRPRKTPYLASKLAPPASPSSSGQ